MKTTPNQNIIRIQKPKYQNNFLQIGLDEIQKVFKQYNKSTIALYLYLASNANNYELALSPAAFEQAYGVKKSAYYEAFNTLVKDGYLVQVKGNYYKFTTVPFSGLPEQDNTQIPDFRKSLSGIQEEVFRKSDIEIDNIYINNNIHSLCADPMDAKTEAEFNALWGGPPRR